MRRAGLGIAFAAAALLIAAAPAGAKTAATWRIGAAKVDTTPPRFDPAQDLQDFPEASCPREAYTGPPLWRFEEPSVDTDASGDVNYPDDGSGAPTAASCYDSNPN